MRATAPSMHAAEDAASSQPQCRGGRAVLSVMMLLAAASVTSCGGEDLPAQQAVVSQVDSAGIRIMEVADPASVPLPTWTLESTPVVSVGEAQGAPEYELFGAISATRLAGGGFAIANAGTAEVRIYDVGGVHSRTLGGRGGGPGEFQSLSWVGVGTADTVIAYDVFQRRVTWFAPDGRLARTATLQPPDIGNPEAIGVAAGHLVMRSGFNTIFERGERRDTVQVYLYDHAGVVVDSLGRYPGPERFFYTAPDASVSLQMPPLYGRTAYAHARVDRIAVGASDSFHIDVFDGARLSLKLRSNHPLRRAESVVVDQIRSRMAESASGAMRAIRTRAIAAVPARETIPAFGGILVDAERWIWVQLHPTHPDEERRWVVFDPDGIPRARLLTPHDLDVYDISSGHILGRQRDESGIERVTLYRLNRDTM
jgi:hypothetical protein